MELLILGILSFAVGIFSGLIGIGGGLMIIPALLFVYPLLINQPSMGIKLATGLSAVQSLTGSLSSVWMHYRNQNAHLGVVILLGISTLLGSFAGGLTTDRYSDGVLTWVYVIVLGSMLIFSIYQRKRRKATEEIPPPADAHLAALPHRGLGFTLGLGIGYLSGLMGIGGAVLLIPLMCNLMKMPVRLAIGSSSGIIFVTSIGTIGGKWMGNLIVPLDAMAVAIGAVGGGVIGAWLSRKLSERFLFWLLMAVIALTLVRMILEL